MNLKWVKDLTVRSELIKVIEENIRELFFGYDTKSISNKSKNQQVRLHQSNELLHNWQLPNSHRDVVYSLENIVGNVEIKVYGAQWVPETVAAPTL